MNASTKLTRWYTEKKRMRWIEAERDDSLVGCVCFSRRGDPDPGGKFTILLDDQLFGAETVDNERDGGDGEVTQLEKRSGVPKGSFYTHISL